MRILKGGKDSSKNKVEEFKESELMHSTTESIVKCIESAHAHGLGMDILFRSLSSIYAHVVHLYATEVIEEIDLLTEDNLNDAWTNITWSAIATLHGDLQLYDHHYKL